MNGGPLALFMRRHINQVTHLSFTDKVNFSKCCHLKIGARHSEVKYELKDSDGVKQEIMEWNVLLI